jgi:multidrug transporter EmrE-like cation transporter
LGTATVAIVGIVYFGESLSWIKIASIGSIVAGVIGLYLANGR